MYRYHRRKKYKRKGKGENLPEQFLSMTTNVSLMSQYNDAIYDRANHSFSNILLIRVTLFARTDFYVAHRHRWSV